MPCLRPVLSALALLGPLPRLAVTTLRLPQVIRNDREQTEGDEREPLELDTRGRMVVLDGRFPHWVTPATGGDRFSVVWYRTTEGPFVERTVAVPEQ